MTNTYQSLCDDVGIKPEKPCLSGKRTCTMPCLDKQRVCQYLAYPPQSAEQRERLEELILKLGRLSYHKSDIYYICILSRVNNTNNGMAGTRPEALYALTHKLVAEGVLSKEEVAKALKGGE